MPDDDTPPYLEPPSHRTESCEPAEFSDDVRETARQTGLDARSAVTVIRPYRDGKPVSTHGTGWFVDEHHIVTNAHITRRIPDDASTQVWTVEQNRYGAEIVGEAKNQDVALLKLTEGSAPSTLTPGDSTALSEGQPLVEVGHPVFVGKWMLSLGTYVKRSESEAENNTADLILDIPDKGGNSGSPILTLDGTVVGLHWGSLFKGDWFEFPPRPTSDEVYTE